MEKKISLFEKIAYGVGDAGCNFVWTTIGSFLILYYTDNVGISAAIVGTIMLLARVVDGIADLGIGVLIDRTSTKWGKARPWILWTALPMGIGLYLVFSVPTSLSLQWKIVYASVTYVVMSAIIYTASNLAYNALLSLEASEQNDRVSMSSIRFFCTLGVVLLISNVTMSLVKKFGWSGMSIIFGAIAVILLLITFFFTKERYEPVNIDESSHKPVVQSFKILFKNKYFVLVTMVFLINYTVLGATNGIGIYYARDVLGNVGVFGTLAMAFFLPKMIGNIFFPKVSKIFGKWKCLMAGYILEIIGVILIMIMPTNISVVLVGLVIKGIGGVPHTAGLFALVGDVVDYGEWKTGERMDGLVNSATSFGMKVGTGVGAALVGWVLAWGGYDASLAQQGAGAIFAMKALYIYIPLALFIIGTIILYFTNIDKIYPVIAKDLAERRIKNNK
jgi:GPH family glycoside/pentoside/hexuronide:cation symporter